MHFLVELKRRHVLRVAVAYAVTSWVLIEVADTIFPRLALPEWTVTLVIALLAIGFPLALVLSWFFELTPEGVHRTASDPTLAAETHASLKMTGRRLDYLVIALLSIAVGYFFWESRLRPDESAVAATPGPVAVAVLPFANISSEPDQEYFSDGLSEDILNLLAQIPELRVTARTSSFSFKGKNASIAEIAHTLGVTHILEGGVRKAGDRLRITAQLIKTDDGFHLWSASYDRRLEDVFAVQSEIAAAIAAALRVKLVAPGRARPALPKTDSLATYERYLQAHRLVQGRTRQGLEAAQTLLAAALELDQDYAPAYAEAAKATLLLAHSPFAYGETPFEQASAAAKEYLDRALELDPELAEAHAVTGLLYLFSQEWERSEAALARALELNPSLSDALNWRALGISSAGRLRDAVAARRSLAELDPLNLSNLASLSVSLILSGRSAEASTVAQRLQQRFPDLPNGFIRQAEALLNVGRLAEAHTAAGQALAMALADPAVAVSASLIDYALGEFEQLAGRPASRFYGPAQVALGHLDEAMEQISAQAAVAPEDSDTAFGLLCTLSAADRPVELLDYYREAWDSPAALADYFGYDMLTAETAPIAAAQHSLGHTEALAETLAAWAERLAFMREQGYASSDFVIQEAHYQALTGEREAALAKLTVAIDLGFRDPLLAHDPAFVTLAGEPAFQSLVQRNLDLIDAERAKLGLAPLLRALENGLTSDGDQ